MLAVVVVVVRTGFNTVNGEVVGPPGVEYDRYTQIKGGVCYWWLKSPRETSVWRGNIQTMGINNPAE